MQQLDIYIEKYKLDIDDSTQVNLTYRYSDLLNPTSITGDFSKTITIKGTPNNNRIFGNIWNLDRKIIFSENSNVNVTFNPAKRTKAVICVNNTVFKTGYVKLNKISVNNGDITYEITFYSELCDVIKSMNEFKLKDLNYPNKLRHIINKDTIYELWSDDHEYDRYLTYVMTNSGTYENFENSKWITKDASNNYVIEDIMNGADFDELSMREYRSYYQRPALLVSGLFQQIKADYENNTDFVINYDSDFFSYGNPYYNSVMMFNRMNTEEIEEQHIGNYDSSVIADVSFDINHDNYFTYANSDYFSYATSEYFEGDNIKPNLLDSKVYIDVEFEIEIRGKVKMTDQIRNYVKVGDRFRFDDFNYSSAISWEILDNTQNNEGMIPYNNPDYYFPAYNNYNNQWKNQYIEFTSLDGDFIMVREGKYYNDFNKDMVYRFPCRFYKNTQSYTDELKLYLRARSPRYIGLDDSKLWNITLNSINIKLYPITKVPYGKNKADYIPAAYTGNDITLTVDNKLQSNAVINLSKILDDNDTTISDFLVDYTKLFGLIWDIQGNQINITTKNNYFKDYKILDWSNKIDYSQTIDISPIAFDKSKLSLKYNNVESRYEKHYIDRFETEYGEQIINTGYEFDDGTPENLISDILFDNTIMSVENTQYYVNDGTNNSTRWLLDDKVLPATFVMEDGTRNQADTTYSLLFRNGWTSTQYTYYVSDDLESLVDSSDNKPDNPVWNNPSYLADRMDAYNKYQQFSRLYKNGLYSWDIGYPRENYAKISRSDYQPEATIFSRYWQNYISEIYNANNKVMTCYVLLTPDDMANFSFKNFININNTLWHVNQIIDYNPVSLQPTQVELMQVSSRDAIDNAYVNGQRID